MPPPPQNLYLYKFHFSLTRRYISTIFIYNLPRLQQVSKENKKENHFTLIKKKKKKKKGKSKQPAETKTDTDYADDLELLANTAA